VQIERLVIIGSVRLKEILKETLNNKHKRKKMSVFFVF